jgi:Tol biopolymer transport system component
VRSIKRGGGVFVVCILGVLGALALLAILLPMRAPPLLFVTALSGSRFSIAALDPDAPFCSQPRFLPNAHSEADITDVRWSMRRDEIVYRLSSGSDMSSLWMVRPDGSGLKSLTPPLPSDFDLSSAGLSPDQRHVALLHRHDERDPNQWDTEILDTQTHASRQVLTGTLFFEWSPSNNLLAIYRWSDGELYVIRPDGTILTHYSASVPGSHQLLWSRDEQEITFASHPSFDQERALVYEIYTLRIQDGVTKQLTDDVEQYEYRSISSIARSPDGKSILFVSSYIKPDKKGENNVLFMLDVASGRIMALADQVTWSAPTWSPDSKQIAFVSTRDGSNYGQIYVMDVGSKQIKQVSCDDDLKQSLSW